MVLSAMESQGRESQPGDPQQLSLTVFQQLQRTELYWELKRHVQHEILKGTQSSTEVPAAISSMLGRANIQLQLQNGVYRLYQEHLRKHRSGGRPKPKLPEGETLDAVASARLKWHRRVREEIEAVASEQGRPLKRQKDEPGAEAEDYTVRFLFDEQVSDN